MGLETVDDLDVGDHVVLARELLVADRAGVVLDVGLVRGDVVPAEVADVGVGAMADCAPVDVALLHAEVANRALGPLGLAGTTAGSSAHAAAATTRGSGLAVRALEVGLTDLGLAARDQIQYGTG